MNSTKFLKLWKIAENKGWTLEIFNENSYICKAPYNSKYKKWAAEWGPIIVDNKTILVPHWFEEVITK